MIHRLKFPEIKRPEWLRRPPHKPSPDSVRDTAEQFARRSTEIWNARLSSSAALAIDRWAGSTLGTANTSYDAAMDAVYNSMHIGGGWHRLFDGAHDVLGAWRAVRDAYPNDKFIDELQGYVTDLWNDLITPNALPQCNLQGDPADLTWHETLQPAAAHDATGNPDVMETVFVTLKAPGIWVVSE